MYSTTAGYKKYSREIICGIEDLLRNDPEARSRSSCCQLKINMNSIYNIATSKDQAKCGPKMKKNHFIGYHIMRS